MSIRAMTAVWDMDLPAKEKLVALALADCANDDGLAWPSITTLARKCGCDRRTIQRNLRNIEEAGFLTRQEVIGRGCKYHFNLRQIATGGKMSPAANCTKRGGKLPPKPSRTVNTNIKRAIPDDWVPSEFGPNTESGPIVSSWTAKEFARHLEQFKANHKSKGNKFTDPQAAWSTWVINTEKFKVRNNNGYSNSKSGRGAAEIARANLGIA